MLTHTQIWTAIDALAARHGLSASALAKLAGLDSTTFNRSKRRTSDGRERWPNTESLSKVLAATGSTLDEFMALLRAARADSYDYTQPIPLIGFAQAGAGGFFDDGGFPVGGGWDQIRFPDVKDENTYALEVSGESMLPLYRDGDIVIVSPNSGVRRGDRVVVRALDGAVMAKILVRKTAKAIELASFNPDHGEITLQLAEVDWIARIIWASQ